jgi:hypothetical protein
MDEEIQIPLSYHYRITNHDFFDTCFYDIGKNKQLKKKIIVLNELFFYF